MKKIYFSLILTASAILAAYGLYNTSISFIHVPQTSVSQYTLYSKWAAKYGKICLTNAEYRYRLKVFQQNQKLARELNAKYPDTKYGLNAFSDLTFKEFINRKTQKETGYNLKEGLQKIIFDNRGDVGVVKKQPLFNNISEAFAGSTMVEETFRGRVTDVSPQYFIDCGIDTKGHSFPDRLKNFLDTYGYKYLRSYPIMDKRGPCPERKGKGIVKFTTSIKYGDRRLAVNDILTPEWVNKQLEKEKVVGTSIGIGPSLQLYREGIYHDERVCKKAYTDYSIVIVGLTEEAYIAQNSQGKLWGQHGYFLIKRENDLFEHGESNCFCGGIGTNCLAFTLSRK